MARNFSILLGMIALAGCAGDVIVDCTCAVTCDGVAASESVEACEPDDKSNAKIAEEGEAALKKTLAASCVTSTAACSCKKTEDPCEQK